LDALDWQELAPNAHGDWINQRDDTFGSWPVVGDKGSQAGPARVFATYSAGVKSNRDAWVYNYSRPVAEANVGRMIDFYNSQVDDYGFYCRQHNITDRQTPVSQFIDTDRTKISWDVAQKNDLAMLRKRRPDRGVWRVAVYRPFCRQNLYFDRAWLNRVYQLPSMFPTSDHENIGFYVVGVGSDKPFSCLMLNAFPDLAFWGSSNGQFFPR
jgi:predicted helicase